MRVFLCLFFIVIATPASADLSYVVKGVDGPLKSNVLEYIRTVQLGREVRLFERDYDEVIATSIAKARRALRPYGFYAPEISGHITRDQQGEHVLELRVNPGPPMVVTDFNLEIKGEGASTSEVDAWRKQWPLEKGAVLDQTLWEHNKQSIIDSMEAIGFLHAKFDIHTLEINLEENTAALNLVFDTGPQFYFGDIDFGVHVLRPGILEYVPRFRKGDSYTAKRMDDFRGDLWRTGYFTDVEVEEVIRLDTVPPQVDLVVRTKTETRDSYQGALGYGSDTGARVLGSWSRHPASNKGDRIDVGIGWQKFNNEYGLRTTYLRPRPERARQFWSADLTIKFENQDLDFKQSDEDKSFFTVANGDVAEQNLRLGLLKKWNYESSNQRLSTTPFIQYLNSDRKFVPIDELSATVGQLSDPDIDFRFSTVEHATSIGIDADLIAIRGKAFETQGHHERAWVFAASESAGSDMDFTQLYISSRRSYLVGNRWKFLLRAEVGYTDADVNQFLLDTGIGVLDLSVTRLPNFYRFKAGGSESVRGYGFEQLSNNNVGSNHVITASAEVEMKILPKWSIAAFVDTGNAFNEWSDPELKTGIGFGIRWYSIAGPIRIDFAQAVDFEGKPWRFDFTIGTPLL